MRHYVKALELKSAGFDWKDYFLRQVLTDAQRTAARFRFDPSFASEEERARAFKAATGKGRATYFNLVRGLKPPAPPPKIILRCRRPDARPGGRPLRLPAPGAAQPEKR